MAEADAPVMDSNMMEGVLSTSAPAAEPSSAPPEDEYSCETLYIQNLNEKIKPEGLFNIFTSYKSTFLTKILFSSQKVVTWAL